MIKSLINKYKTVPVEVRASLFYTICSVVQKFIVLITLPIFTRLMTTEQFGQYSIYQSWISIVAIFCTLNLHYGSFDTAMIKFEDDRDRYISSIQGLVSVLTLVTFVIYLISPRFWSEAFDLPKILIVAMLIETLCSTILQFWTNKKRFTYEYKPMVAVTLLISVLSPIMGLIGVCLFKEKGIARILGNVIVYFFIGTYLYVYHIKKGKTLYDKKYWSYALKFNIPLIPYYLSQMIFNQSDRIMINNISGAGDAALYSLAYQFAIVLIFVINSINSAFIPWKYKNIKNENYIEIKKVSNILVILIAIMLLVLMLFTPEAIQILGGKKYIDAIWVVPPVAGSLLFLFLTQLCINVMFYFEEKKYLVRGSILSAIANIILNAFLIPIFGYVAAGYTTLLSYILFWICNMYYMNKTCIIRIKEYKHNMLFDWKTISFISIMFILLTIIISFTYNAFIIRVLFIILILIMVLLKKNMIIDYIKLIRGKEM